MLDKKGQALIEFILILPVLIMLIFSVIDFGRIFVNKNELETSIGVINDLDRTSLDETTIYNEVNKNKSPKIEVAISEVKDGYITITLTRKIDLITPGLNLILSSPYVVEADRVIKYE